MRTFEIVQNLVNALENQEKVDQARKDYLLNIEDRNKKRVRDFVWQLLGKVGSNQTNLRGTNRRNSKSN